MEKTDIIINSFSEINIHANVVTAIIAVYDSPSGYEGKYVARLWDKDGATKYVVVKDKLNEIRNAIPHTFVRMNRLDGDSPALIERYI